MEIKTDHEAVETKPPRVDDPGKNTWRDYAWQYSYPPKYVCCRCGEAICKGDNGSELRSLALYCERCAEKIVEARERRVRSAAKFAPRIVRVKRESFRTRDGRLVEIYTEYRGQFPLAVICGGGEMVG